MTKVPEFHEVLPRAAGKRPIYCVPYAISAITGKTIETVEAAINAARNLPSGASVRGVHQRTVRHVLGALGYKTTLVKDYDRTLFGAYARAKEKPTLARVIRERDDRLKNSMLLVLTTTHAQLLKGRKFNDNFTKGPVFTGSAPHRRSRVAEVYVVEQL